MCNPNSEILSIAYLRTTPEQASLVQENKPLVNFNLTIHQDEQQMIRISEESDWRQLLGILRGDILTASGSIKLQGREINYLQAAERSRLLHDLIGFIDFDEKLIPYLTVLENICAGFWHLPREMDRYRIHIQAFMHWFELDQTLDCLPRELSPTQRIEVQFLKAFIHQPKIVIAVLPREIPKQSISDLQTLARATHTALFVLMPMATDQSNDGFFTGKMVGGFIEMNDEVLNEYLP